MPKRKRSTRSRRTDFSRPKKTHKYYPKSTSTVKKICQKLIDKNTEFKRYVRELSSTAVVNISNGQILFQGPPIAQGPSALERDGNEVMLRKLRFRLMFKSIGSSNRVRLVCVQYPQTAGALNTLEDVLTNVSTAPMISPWKKDGTVKYRILYNRVHKLAVLGSMDGSYKYQGINIDIKFPKAGLPLHYDDGTTANPDKNNIMLYCVADQALASPNQNEVQMYTEAVFTDL
jgi:hypothetical protein